MPNKINPSDIIWDSDVIWDDEPQQPQQAQPQQPGGLRRFARKVAPYSREVLPMVGALAGGVGGAVAGPIGSLGGAGLGYAGGAQAQDLIEQYGGITQPKGAGRELLETGQDIGKGVGFELLGGAIGKAAMKGAKPLIKMVEPQINKMIDFGIKKAIRPSVAGKATIQAAKSYFNKARDAVKSIVGNKNNLKFYDENGNMYSQGRVPKTLEEFNQSVSNTKKSIFTQYDDMAKQANQYGETVDANSVIPELDKIIKSVPTRNISPEIVEHAIKRKGELLNVPRYNTTDAQKAIELYNQKLKTYFKSPDANAESIAKIDSMIANHLRKSLDDVIEKGSTLNSKLKKDFSYQQLKNKYGALKTIEKDINQRAIVDGRKNKKGLIDFTDVFTSGDIVGGLVAGSPVHVTKGIVGKVLAGTYKYLNEPNTIVKNMFSGVEKAMSKYPKARFFDTSTAKKAAGYVTAKQLVDPSPGVPEALAGGLDAMMGATASPAQAMTVEQMATKAYLDGDHKKSLGLFQRAIRTNPKNAAKYKTAINQILQEIKGLQSRNINLRSEV